MGEAKCAHVRKLATFESPAVAPPPDDGHCSISLRGTVKTKVFVGVGAEPLRYGATLIARGLRPHEEPAILSILAPQPEFDFVAFVAGEGARQVVRMNKLCPCIAQDLRLNVGVEILDALLIGPVQLTIRTARSRLEGMPQPGGLGVPKV